MSIIIEKIDSFIAQNNKVLDQPHSWSQGWHDGIIEGLELARRLILEEENDG